MEINVDVQVNRQVKTCEDGSFLSGRVYFTSRFSLSVPTDAKCSTAKEDYCEQPIGTEPLPISAEVFGGLLDSHLFTESIRVNLSRTGTNPNCNMRIDSLDAHDHHAPMFSSQGDMEDYISRIMSRVAEVVEVIDIAVPEIIDCCPYPDSDGEVLPEGGYWAINPDQGDE